MRRLRAPDGCPWDREQTHRSLAVCLAEECAELLDTIEREDFPHMREELGDVLLQVVYHAILAEEEQRFELEDVVREINDKLIRRHPHVFGEESLATSQEVLLRWEAIKQSEKQNTTPKPVPPSLSGLLFAKEVLKSLERSGREAELGELPEGIPPTTSDQAGDFLLAYVAACRRAGIDAETALRTAARRRLESEVVESEAQP